MKRYTKIHWIILRQGIEKCYRQKKRKKQQKTPKQIMTADLVDDNKGNTRENRTDFLKLNRTTCCGRW
jgi:hypothetical protein